MFAVHFFPVGSRSDLRVFLCNNPTDAFALAVDLAGAVGIKSDSIRAEMSRHNIGSLEPFPALKRWFIDNEHLPSSTGKLQFAASEVWLKLLQRHSSKMIVTIQVGSSGRAPKSRREAARGACGGIH